MADLSILFQNVSFSYKRVRQPLIRDLSLNIGRGWTGIVGANGVGKSTLLKLATGGLKPQAGRVVIPEFTIYCRQRTDTPPVQLQALIDAMGGEAFRIKGQLGVAEDWRQRWPTLSHGERNPGSIALRRHPIL